MHSSTITAFLLPLLLSSVLAVPTRVQNNEAATRSGPAPAQRSIIGVQYGPAPSPTPGSTKGLTAMDIYAEQGMAAEETAIAEGKDPQLCSGSCTRSLKGRQNDPEADDKSPEATDPTEGETAMDE